MKICSKCKIEKDLSEFWRDETHKDSFRTVCKECIKKYQLKNSEKIRSYQKIYRKENYKILIIKQHEYREENKIQLKIISKRWREGKANHDTFAPQISYAEKIRNVDGFLQTKCAYCGKWYFPTNSEIQIRIKSLNGKQSGEGRLYCSNECKTACPIYKKSKFQEGRPLKNQNSSREVQPELRQMVFERDNYICLKCGKYQDELDVPIHCHHIEGIRWNPLESADINQCMTVCKDCHIKIHKQKDCRYVDMRCKTKEKK